VKTIFGKCNGNGAKGTEKETDMTEVGRLLREEDIEVFHDPRRGGVTEAGPDQHHLKKFLLWILMSIPRERKLLSTCIPSKMTSNFFSEENLVSVEVELGNEAVRKPFEFEQGKQEIARRKRLYLVLKEFRCLAL